MNRASISTSVLTEIAEMKRAYSALEASLPHRTPLCIAVTSAAEGEGKTTMLSGLAALAARETGKRVLALDLNWHSPSLHSVFGVELIDPDKAQNGAPLKDLVYHVPEAHLDVLPAIKEHLIAELENGQEQELAERLLEKARCAYDIIFVDTSRVYPTNRHMIDPVAIAHKVDGVAMVVAPGMTPRQVVRRTQFALESAGAHILGVIINKRNSNH